jgi:hypothetical protein
VIYVVEFYWANADGSREEVARQWQQAPSQQIIEARARAVIKNVLLGGRRANLCIIKGAKGETLGVEVGDPATAVTGRRASKMSALLRLNARLSAPREQQRRLAVSNPRCCLRPPRAGRVRLASLHPTLALACA